jgi:hypothetical protein
MLDDLRQSTAHDFEEEPKAQVQKPPAPRFLGMTGGQRFTIAFILLFMAVVLGAFCLLIAGRIVLPF